MGGRQAHREERERGRERKGKVLLHFGSKTEEKDEGEGMKVG